MKALGRSHFWWPNLDSDIEALVNNCQTCQLNRHQPKVTRCSGGVQTCIRELSVVVPSICLYPDLTSHNFGLYARGEAIKKMFVWQATIFDMVV